MRSFKFVLFIVLLAGQALPAHAQNLRYRLWRSRLRAAGVQMVVIPGGNDAGRARIRRLADTVPDAASGPAARKMQPEPEVRRPWTVYVDTRVGFDRDKVLLLVPVPTEIDVRRQIYIASLALQREIDDKTRVSLSLPYVHQTTRLEAPGFSLRQTGKGIGDASVMIERRLTPATSNREASLAAGLTMPTGKDPFGLAANELPTGLGFFQPSLRLTLRRFRVPVQLYAIVDYSTSLSRRINGQRMRLPASYGGEIGFYYALGPEFTAQTALSVSKLSSPFITEPRATVGYLTESLLYSTGTGVYWRGAAEVGLTDDSTDTYFSLTWNRDF